MSGGILIKFVAIANHHVQITLRTSSRSWVQIKVMDNIFRGDILMVHL